MSTKQIQAAVVRGRRVTFHPGYDLEPVVGYVVGMDDFHWMVAQPTATKGEVMTTLVHKRSPVVIISNEDTLDQEDAADKIAIGTRAQKFSEYCQSQLDKEGSPS